MRCSHDWNGALARTSWQLRNRHQFTELMEDYGRHQVYFVIFGFQFICFSRILEGSNLDHENKAGTKVIPENAIWPN